MAEKTAHRSAIIKNLPPFKTWKKKILMAATPEQLVKYNKANKEREFVAILDYLIGRWIREEQPTTGTLEKCFKDYGI